MTNGVVPLGDKTASADSDDAVASVADVTVEPAIQEARERGIDAQGPVPADMVFVRALDGDFDGVVCMYHDQANIARKLQPKQKGATFYMGLPVVCGTTAHGTAFDKAGQGMADPGSLEAALKYTVMLSSVFR